MNGEHQDTAAASTNRPHSTSLTDLSEHKRFPTQEAKAHYFEEKQQWKSQLGNRYTPEEIGEPIPDLQLVPNEKEAVFETDF